MKDVTHYDFCIVGAGPSGLTLAYQLLRAGKRVLLLERDARAGGLAKSYNYDGNIFDTGPKRFHTDDPLVQSFIEHIGSVEQIGRSTKVHFAGKYFNWPLEVAEFFKMPLNVGFQSFIGMLTRPNLVDKESFEQYIQNRYGYKLFDVFFKPYTEKFLQWDVTDIHADWATTGINRTVIDKRVKANTIVDLFSSLLLPSKVETNFLYPTEGGFGFFFDKLFSLCVAETNFECQFNTTITKLRSNPTGQISGFTANNSPFICDKLIWSGNLKDLNVLVNGETSSLNYLNTIFYNFVCKESAVNKKNRAQWIYVSDGNTLISRITCMSEFNSNVFKDGYYNFICEVTDSQAKPFYWQNPKAQEDRIIKELLNMKFLLNREGIEAIISNSIKDTYPIYKKNYKSDFSKVVANVRAFSKNIHLLGRSGAFWYNNSDHSIKMSLDMADKLLSKSDKTFDHRAYFG